LYDRFKFVVIEYGKVALAFHASGMPIRVGLIYIRVGLICIW
jgi:hypothetical protein